MSINTITHRLKRSGVQNADKFLRDLILDLEFFQWVRKHYGNLDWFDDLYCHCDDLIQSKHQGRILKLLKSNDDFLELAHHYLSTLG